MARRLVSIALSLTALIGGGATAAESLRCGNAFIRSGTSADAVRERCGEPDEFIIVAAQGGDEEHWIYRTRWSLDGRLLVFRDESLVRIERLPAGRSPGTAA